MERIFPFLGALFAFLAVAAGAFGAHGLRNRLSSDMLIIFETAVRYQMYHSLGLLFVAWAQTRAGGWVLQAAGWSFVLGILIFCGSLYLLTLTDQRWLGAITPIGGFAFLVGWALLAWWAWRASGI